MANADIKLLFGVLGGGSISEGSGLEIKKSLDEILSAINKEPLKIKVALETDSNRKSSWTAQLQKKLDALDKNNKLSITVSNIKLGTNAITSFKRQLGAIINTLNLDKDVSISFTAKDIGEITSQFKSAEDATSAATKQMAEFNVQMEILSTRQKAVKDLLSSLEKTVNTNEERAKLAELNALYQQWAVKIESVRISKTAASATVQAELMAEGVAIRDNISALLESARAAQERVDAEEDASQKSQNAEKAHMATLREVISAYKQISSYINKNPRIDGNELTQLQSMRDQLYGIWQSSKNATDGIAGISKVDLRNILSDFASLDTSLTEAGKKGNTFVGIISSAYKKFGGWMLVTRSLMLIVHSLKDMVTNVIELDSAMTELRKVTDETDASYSRFFDKAITRSKQLGATLSDTITATADFARLGYSIDDAATLADAALVYKNVGDGIEDISVASESIISTMKAFRIEATSAMLIVDKFNEVGNNFAISSKGVGDALVRSASALAAAGNSLDESIALITAANTIVQDPDVVGTTMKTLSMYLRAAKTEAEEAGESTEGMANSISELRSEILALTGGKVDIQIDENTFKNTTQILRELSIVWNDLTDITQANILEMIGGKRNANTVSALIDNFDLVEEVIKSSSDAIGSALSENEKYLDSINGKIAQFQAAFQALSATFINSDWIKGAVDLGTDVVERLTDIINMLGSIPTLITSITGALTVYQKTKSRNDFGLFGLIGGKIGFDPSGVRGIINEYNNLLGKSIDEQNSFISTLRISDASLAGYLETVTDGNASLKNYKTYCKQAGIETKTLGTTSKAASIGVTLLNTAINMLVSLGVTLVIQGLITSVTNLANATDRAIERTQELNNSFKEFKEANADNIKTLNSLKSEFDELSKGVSRYGENIALTSDDYERYKEIIETIVGISPSLSEGYQKENGYFVDKNNLIERAIELQEQQYRQELRQMTTIENLKTGMEGYIATYDDLRMDKTSTTKTDLTNSIYQLFKINDRDVVPNFAEANSTDDKSVYLAEQIIKSLGIDNVNAEIEKYLNEHGYFQIGAFFNDYAESIAHNYEKIATSIDYSAIGYKTKAEFDKAIGIVGDAATAYLDVQDQMADANYGIANQLKLVAEANEDYANLSDEAQNIVSNFINRFGVEDVYRQDWWGKWAPDEDAIRSVRVQIEDFIESLTPEVQSAISGIFDLKGLFDAGNINVGEFRSKIDAIIADLDTVGFDSESVKYLRLSLETDMVDKQLSAVREAINGLDGQYDEVLGGLNIQELSYAYKIVIEEGSLTFDELLSKIEQFKRELTPVKDFEGIVSNVQELESGLQQLGNIYKDVLDKGVFDWSSILNNEEFSKIFSGFSDEYSSFIETVTSSSDNIEVCQAAFDKLVSAYIDGSGILNDVTEETRNATVSILEQSGVSNAAAIVDEKLATQKERLKYTTGEFVDAEYEEIAALYQSCQAGELTKRVLAQIAIEKYQLSNTPIKTTSDVEQLIQLAENAGVTADSISKLIEAKSLMTRADGLLIKINSAQSKEEVDKLVGEYNALIANAYNLTNKPFEYENDVSFNFSPLDISSSTNQVEEYLAEIDKYYEANKKLESIQKLRADISGQLEDETGLSKKIELENQLLEAYSQEITAEKELLRLKSDTINKNAEALRTLGFEVEYNSDTNELLISNIEKLNDLTADSVGKYGSLQEATNALRKDTESLIASTEELNEENASSVDSIKDIESSILDSKQNILNYIQEMVDEADGALSQVTEVYDTLQSAVKSYNESGFLTTTMFQSILSLGTKYLSFLYDENGAIRFNEDAIRNLIAAKIEDLAVTKAMALVDTVKEHKDDAEALRALADASYQASNATWDMVYANLALIGLDDEMYDAFAHQIDMIRQLSDSAKQGIGVTTGSLADSYNDASDALDYIIDKTKELIRYENEQQVKALEDQIDAYQKLIDLKKEALQAAKDESDYEQSVADKVKEIAELQARIDQLSLDDSRSATAERNSLLEELADKQKELSDIQSDHAIDSQQNALDDMAAAYEEQKRSEIAVLQNTISSEEKIYQMAIQRIQMNWGSLYQDLMSWNAEVGNSISSEITENWYKAANAVRTYGSYVNAVTSINNNLDRIDSGSGNVIAGNVPKFHNGGVVGNYDANNKEVLALLEKGEIVLNKDKEQALYHIIDFQEELSRRLGMAIGSLRLSNDFSGMFSGMFGNAQRNNKLPSGIIDNSARLVFEPHIDVSIQGTEALSDADATKYGNRIADVTIDKLYDAFKRKGIFKTKNSILMS